MLSLQLDHLLLLLLGLLGSVLRELLHPFLLLERCAGPDGANEERWWWQFAHDILAVAGLTLQNMPSERTELLSGLELLSGAFLEESIGDDYANYVVASITGTVTYSYSTFEIAPRNASDFVFAPTSMPTAMATAWSQPSWHAPTPQTRC